MLDSRLLCWAKHNTNRQAKAPNLKRRHCLNLRATKIMPHRVAAHVNSASIKVFRQSEYFGRQGIYGTNEAPLDPFARKGQYCGDRDEDDDSHRLGPSDGATERASVSDASASQPSIVSARDKHGLADNYPANVDSCAVHDPHAA
jgi:hypothetical protein